MHVTFAGFSVQFTFHFTSVLRQLTNSLPGTCASSPISSKIPVIFPCFSASAMMFFAIVISCIVFTQIGLPILNMRKYINQSAVYTRQQSLMHQASNRGCEVG